MSNVSMEEGSLYFPFNNFLLSYINYAACDVDWIVIQKQQTWDEYKI